MNKILFNFVMVGVSLAVIAGASAGRVENHAPLGMLERDLRKIPMQLSDIHKPDSREKRVPPCPKKRAPYRLHSEGASASKCPPAIRQTIRDEMLKLRFFNIGGSTKYVLDNNKLSLVLSDTQSIPCRLEKNRLEPFHFIPR